jgi:hypothetical protein
MESEIVAELLAEVKRLHERMDMWETAISKLAEAVKANPMLRALIPAEFKVS